METESNLKAILYMTVNTVNNKIYIGVHITEKPYEFDNYWGDGITGTGSYWFKHPKYPFQKACKKYGLDVFRRYTLKVFDTYEEALAAEKEMVDEEFVKRPDTYNVALGGGSGLVESTEKPVYKYDLEGNYIEEFRSRSDAARKLDVGVSSIIKAIQRKGICMNFYWSETKVAKLNLQNFYISNIKKVYSYKSDGSFYKEYESASAASRDLDVTANVIQRAIKNENKCSGYYLSFEKVDKFIKSSKKRIRHNKLYRYSLDGDFIDEMTFEDAKKVCGSEYKRLSNAIREHYSCGGYLWKYEKLPSITPVKQTLKKKINQYDLNGNLIKVWDSYRECEKYFSNAGQVLKGHRSHTKGFIFKYNIEKN